MDQLPKWPKPWDLTGHLPEWRGIRTERRTYVEHVTGDFELYDDTTDPYQALNRVCAAAQDVLTSLHAMTVALSTCAVDSCRRLENQ